MTTSPLPNRPAETATERLPGRELPPPRAGAPIPALRRLSVRFAALLVVLLLVAYTVGPRLSGLGERLIDRFWPLPEPRPVVVERPWRDGQLQEPYQDLLHVPVDESDLLHRLVNWSERGEGGALLPPPSVVEDLSRELELYGQAFAWTDASGRVLAASPGLGALAGTRIDLHTERVPANIRAGARSEPDHPNVWRVALPVHLSGELAGILHVFTIGSPREGLLAEGSTENEPEPSISPERQRRRERLAAGIELLTFVLVALGSSLVLSRLVTRRLSDLAEQAAVPLADTDQEFDPVPRGRDEIAVLSGALTDLRRRARELISSLTQQDRERRSWIALISHDLRTPLTALTACLEGALRDLEPAPDRKEAQAVVRRVKVALEDAERLRLLTDDLLDIARLDTEKAIALEEVPPGEIARHAARVMAGFAERHGRLLEVEVARGLPTLEADGGRLLRALENLIRNGIEHARERVLLRVSSSGAEEISFEVEDDGRGLPLLDDGSVDWTGLAQRKARADSAGLGLSVVRRVAEAHGGRLEAKNGPRGGALFQLRLPLG